MFAIMENLNRPPRTAAFSRRAGFTLTELLIAMTISVVLCGMATYFLFEGLRASLKTSAIYTNDMTQWGLTNRLMIDTKLANNIEIFADNSSATLTAAATYTNNTPAGGVAKGTFGNFIVLALGAMAEVSTTQQQYQYSSLYGYYYNPTAKTLSRFQYAVSASDSQQSTYNTSTGQVSGGLEAIVKEHLGDFQYTVVGTDLTLQPLPTGATGTNGAFLNRIPGQLANMLLRASAGLTNTNNSLTRSDRMIEVAFYARQ